MQDARLEWQLIFKRYCCILLLYEQMYQPDANPSAQGDDGLDAAICRRQYGSNSFRCEQPFRFQVQCADMSELCAVSTAAANGSRKFPGQMGREVCQCMQAFMVLR